MAASQEASKSHEMARAELDARLKAEASFRESLERQAKDHTDRTQLAMQTAAAGQASTEMERKARELAETRWRTS